MLSIPLSVLLVEVATRMSRSVAYRIAVSDAVSWRQDQALNSTIYILRTTGPTGFLLKEEGETKKFKVLHFHTYKYISVLTSISLENN